MYSIAFPDIFNGAKVNLNKDFDAVKVNLKSLLMSNRGGLYGDPHYGVNIKKILWGQAASQLVLDMKGGNNWKAGKTPMTIELLKDEIFDAIYSYMPQVEIKRDDINVKVQGNIVQASIELKADSTIPSNLFNIQILLDDEN